MDDKVLWENRYQFRFLVTMYMSFMLLKTMKNCVLESISPLSLLTLWSFRNSLIIMGITNERQISGYPNLIYADARKHAVLAL